MSASPSAGRPVVLFLCTGNSARSQMAEGLLRAKAGDRFQAASAGTEPAARVHPLAVEVMAEMGIDLSSQRPKPVADFLVPGRVDHLIVVCSGADSRCPKGLAGVRTRQLWDIEDPAAARATPLEALHAFRAARDEIAKRLDGWLKGAPAP